MAAERLSENDRSSTGNVADGPGDPVNENTLRDWSAGKVDDRLHVHGRLLAGEREQAPCPVPSHVIAYVSILGRDSHSPDSVAVGRDAVCVSSCGGSPQPKVGWPSAGGV